MRNLSYLETGKLAIKNERIGILGGSFDPVHIGHIQVASGVANRLDLDEVRLLPCSQHALGKLPGANAAQRLKMMELALANQPRTVPLTIDSRELQREGLSYSITSCREIRAELGHQAVLVFIIGSDLLDSLHKWHEWQSLLDYVNLVVVDRAAVNGAPGDRASEGKTQSGQPVTEVREMLEAAVTDLDRPSGQVVRVDLPPYAVSSTLVREQVQALYTARQHCESLAGQPASLETIREKSRIDPELSRALDQLQTSVDSRVLSFIVENQLYSKETLNHQTGR